MKKPENKLNLLSIIFYILSVWFIFEIYLFGRWIYNQAQVNTYELLLPSMINLIITAIIVLIFLYIYKKNNFAGLLGAGIISFYFANFSHCKIYWIEPLKIYFQDNLILSAKNIDISIFLILLIIFLTIIIVCFWIINFTTKHKFDLNNFYWGLVICIASIFLMQFYTVIKISMAQWDQEKYIPEKISINAPDIDNLPDIYYLVFDRYTNKDVLDHQIHYDNTVFLDNLSSKGFYIDNSAYSNYPYTTMSISSTLKASYHDEISKDFGIKKYQTAQAYHNIIQNSPAIEALRNIGYTTYQLGSWYEATSNSKIIDRNLQIENILKIFGKKYVLSSFEKMYINDSILGRIINNGLSIGDCEIISLSSDEHYSINKEKIEILNNLSSQYNQPKFIFAHMLLPHDPYVFNADGSESIYQNSDNEGYFIKEKYAHQLAFTNTQIQKIIDNILVNDSNAIIILQSDEGPYPIQLNTNIFDVNTIRDNLYTSDMSQWSQEDLQMKYGVLAAYHIPKATDEELEKYADNVNIFRLIFNKYFNAEMDYLPRCYYGLSEGKQKPFLWTNINDKLGVENQNCPE